MADQRFYIMYWNKTNGNVIDHSSIFSHNVVVMEDSEAASQLVHELNNGPQAATKQFMAVVEWPRAGPVRPESKCVVM